MRTLPMFGLLLVLAGCTSAAQGTWQRQDGTQIVGNAALTQKKQVDIAACSAEVSKVDVLSNAPMNRREHAGLEIMTGCMMQRGYHLVKG